MLQRRRLLRTCAIVITSESKWPCARKRRKRLSCETWQTRRVLLVVLVTLIRVRKWIIAILTTMRLFTRKKPMGLVALVISQLGWRRRRKKEKEKVQNQGLREASSPGHIGISNRGGGGEVVDGGEESDATPEVAKEELAGDFDSSDEESDKVYKTEEESSTLLKSSSHYAGETAAERTAREQREHLRAERRKERERSCAMKLEEDEANGRQMGKETSLKRSHWACILAKGEAVAAKPSMTHVCSISLPEWTQVSELMMSTMRTRNRYLTVTVPQALSIAHVKLPKTSTVMLTLK